MDNLSCEGCVCLDCNKSCPNCPVCYCNLEDRKLFPKITREFDFYSTGCGAKDAKD